MTNKIAALFFLFLPIVAFSQQSTNGTFAVSQIAISPLSAALGGSQIASFAGDVNQLVANPALLDSALDESVSMGYLNYLTDINQASVAYSHMIDSVGFVSGYLRYMDYGTFTETDEVGNELGKFKTTDYELGFSFTKAYSNHLSYGVTFKQFFSGFYSYSAYGMALDFGGYYHGDKGLTMGATLDDLGAKLVDYNKGGAGRLPASLNFSMAKKFAKAPLRLGFQYNQLNRWDLAANDIDELSKLKVNPLTGESTRNVVTFDNFIRHLMLSAAIIPTENVNILIGYNFRRRLELAVSERPGLVGFSIGALVKIKRFGIQYAVSSYQLNGASHTLAVTTNLNEWYSKKHVK